MISKDRVWEALKKVIDPELHINIVDLGLVYEIQIKSQNEKLKMILIEMTLTTMGCPLGPWFQNTVKEEVATELEIKIDQVEVMITFDPPWHQGLMNEEAIAELGLD